MFLAVSSRVSPFTTEDVDPDILTVSAERRLPAISNDKRVRVLASKKALIIVLPRRVGTFLISLELTSLKASAVSRIISISSLERGSMPRICLCLNDIPGSSLTIKA